MRRLALIAATSALVASGCDKSGSSPTPPSEQPAGPAVADNGEGVSETPQTDPATPAEPETPEVAPSEPTGETGDAPVPETPAVETPTAETPTSNATDQTKQVAELPKRKFKSVNKSCGNDGGKVGTKLKGFKLQNTKGKTVGNRSFGSRVLLVNFWGTWCKPCLKELPEFDRLFRRYRKHGMTLVAIATDEEAEPVQEIATSKKLRAKMLIGGEDYAGKYGARNFPFSFVVDPKGTIVGSYYNYKPECMGKLEDDIRKALEKRNSK